MQKYKYIKKKSTHKCVIQFEEACLLKMGSLSINWKSCDVGIYRYIVRRYLQLIHYCSQQRDDGSNFWSNTFIHEGGDVRKILSTKCD